MGTKMMIVMRRDLKMRTGKIAAQAGHACIDAVLRALQKEDRMNDLVMSADGMMLNNSDKPTSPLVEWFKEQGVYKEFPYSEDLGLDGMVKVINGYVGSLL